MSELVLMRLSIQIKMDFLLINILFSVADCVGIYGDGRHFK